MCGQTFLEDTLARIAQKSARSGGQSERPNHTLVCLEVMEERGLISLERQSGGCRSPSTGWSTRWT